MDEILTWSNIPRFGVIHEKVEGNLYHNGYAPRTPTAAIGIGIEEYVKGDR